MTTTNTLIPENKKDSQEDVFIFPTSFPQKRIWLLSQIDPNNYAYNNYSAIKLKGEINLITLEKTLNEIVRRHESLRTKFAIVKGEPVQVVLPSLTFKLALTDLQTIPDNQKEAKVKQLIEQEIKQPFDLKQLPLIRFSLLQLRENEYILITVIHHIISDGWFGKVMMGEMATLYTVFTQNQPSPLPELPIQYADYTIHQEKYLQGKVLENLINYWQQQLKNLSVLELPTDKPRPTVETYRGATKTFTLSPKLCQAIKTLSQQQGVTLFMTLLAAFKILLLRYTQQKDIAVGTPIANRNSTEIENLIGVFINTLVLRTNLADNPTFLELLTQVRKIALEAYTHQEMPFEKLVEVLQPERDLGRSPLFQVMFVLQNNPISTAKLPGLTIEPIPIENQTSKFDLTLYMEEVSPEKPSMLEHSMGASNLTGSGMIGVFEYNTDIFAAETIERMTEHFQILLDGIVANPERPISELPLLTAQEQQKLLEWNNTKVDYPQTTLHQLFEAQVEKTPDAVAVEFEGERLTYLQLNQKANQLANYLQSLGVGADVFVGICVERSLEMVIGLLGILKAGGAYVPIDPNYPSERIELMLSDSQASVLLTQKHLMTTLPKSQARVLYLDSEEIFTKQSSENLISNINGENLAYVIYTSGSTGKPKGVQIPHRAVVNFLLSMQQQPGMTKEDVLLAVTTISFDIAGLEIYLPLITGAKVVLASRAVATDGIELAKLISTSGTTIMQATPATWRLLLASGWQGNLQEVRSQKSEVRSEVENRRVSKPNNLKILCGGEALPTDLAQQLLSCGNSVWNLYGPTETTIWSTVCQVDLLPLQREEAIASIPIGRPIANTQIFILDHQQQPVPLGVAGELYIGGAGLSCGYLNRPELTAEKFISAIPLLSPLTRGILEEVPSLTTEKIEKVPPFSRGVRGDRLSLYKTGDLARYLPDGTIEYIGRIDNQVKLRGFRIELGEIEAILARHPAVQQGVVIAHEIKPGDKRLVAYLICHSEKPTTEELRNFLQDKLPEYMIPSAFVILESFPLTPNGKINRRALKPPKDFGISQDSFVPPTTPVEKKLATIWSEILGVEKIGIHDNFFQIGGHSLLIVQLQTRLEEIFKSNLTVADLFKHPTINTQAEIIEITSTTPTKKISIQPVSRELNLPLSFNQQRLWFLDQLEKNSAAYNMLLPARLSGHLDLEVLQQAFTEIIRRHEVLRTSFQMVDGEAVQIISDEANFNLSVIDWREVAETNREQQIQEFAISEGQRSFDLTQNPLLRVTVLQLTDTEYVLIFVIHHIISDDWSSGIIIRELATLYDTFASGKRSPLSELSIQYADFAHWQQQYLQSDLFAEQLTYWQQQLAEVPTVLALPTDRPRPQVQNFQGATTMLKLPSKLSDKIKQVSQSEEVTLFMMLLTGFQTLLYCYTQQQDFCVGSPIANRNSRETEGIIGFFVNTLVLRAELSGNPSFRELLQRVREVAIGAFAHQDLPFEKLLEELNIERSLSHNPLFQVWFVLHNVPMPKLEMGGCRLEPLHFDSGLVRHDLRLGLWETQTGFSGSFQYKTDLFDAETINLMVKDLEKIFSHLVANLDMRLNEILDIINASKKQKQIMEEQKLENNNRQKLKKMKRKSVR